MADVAQVDVRALKDVIWDKLNTVAEAQQQQQEEEQDEEEELIHFQQVGTSSTAGAEGGGGWVGLVGIGSARPAAKDLHEVCPGGCRCLPENVQHCVREAGW
jgi:hypothetical protein